MLSLCLAASLDGKLNSETPGAPRFTSRADRDRLFRLRAEADLLLVGAGTVRAEGLAPTVRNPRFESLRGDRPAHPAVAVVSRGQDLPWDAPYFRQREQEMFLVTDRATDATRARCTELQIPCVEMQGRGLGHALRCLQELGYRRILAEGGGHLVHSLLSEDLVERLYLTLAPVILAGERAPTLATGAALPRPHRWKLDRVRQVEDELHLSYTRARG
jgi:5-amino-6-(5-phosphoribosylamino)uracil reductase